MPRGSNRDAPGRAVGGVTANGHGEVFDPPADAAADPAPEHPQSNGGPEEPREASRSRSRLIAWIAAGVVVAVVVILAVVASLSGGAKAPVASPTTPGATLAPGARIPFAFRLTSVTQTSYTGKDSDRAARRAAGFIRSQLSSWYDAAFFDPSGWASGPADAAWGVFERSIVRQARTKDARALSLGRVGGLDELMATRSRLFVRVLLDPSLHPVAAIATVSLVATGTLPDGNLLRVSNDARFLLRVVDGRWTIVGYPAAKTTRNEVPAPSPTPVPGPSGSGSVSPSAPASG